MLCDYGCGYEAKYQLKNGNWCCSKYPPQCSAIRHKIKNTVTELHEDENSVYNRKKDIIRKKQSKSQFKAWSKETHKCKTKEVKDIQRNINLKNRKDGVYSSKEYHQKLSKAHKKLWSDPNSSYNSKERSDRISKTMKKLYFDKEYLNKLQKGLKTKPNRIERVIINLLKNISNDFVFVGDFKKWIGGKNPDFINIKTKQIIEVFGDYWHSEEQTGLTKEKHENDRIEHFRNFGFDTIVIWEHELQNENKLLIKIMNFLNQ